jgi:peptidoglycan hydrolase-like protein with peptidoglycan-binding domain
VAWTETMHPRNPKGAGGGEFKNGGTGKQAGKSSASHGSMSYNGKTGTGYGSKNGDPRVRKLQAALNKLGLKDAQGRPLKLDGKLGPLTTQAIKAWQRKNGMKADGVVTTAMLKQATSRGTGRKISTAHIRARAAKKTSGRMAGK